MFFMNDPSWILLLQPHTDVLYEWPVMDTVVTATYRCSLWMTRHGYCCCSDIQMFLLNDPSWILLLQPHTDVLYEWPVMDTVVAATYRCSLWMTRHGYCCYSHMLMFLMNDPSWILLLQRHTDVPYEWPVMDTVVAATYRCSLWMTRHGYCCYSHMLMFLLNDPSWILLLQPHTDVLYEWPVMDTVVTATYRCSLWMTRHGYCCCSPIQMFLMNDPSWILLLQRHTDVPYEWPVMDTVVAATYRCSLWMTRHGYCCCSDIQMFFMNDPSWILLLQRHTDVLYEWPVMDTVVAATYGCSLWMTRHGYCCCSHIQMFFMSDPSWILLLQRHTDVLYEWPVMDTVVAATYRCSLWMTRHGYCCCSDIQMFFMNDPSWILLLQPHTDVLYEWPVMDTVVAATYRCSLWMTRHGYCCCSDIQMLFMNDPSWILLLQRHTDVLYEWPVMDTVVAATYRCSLWMTRHGYCCCSPIQMFFMNDPSWILLLQRHTDVLYEWPVMDTVVAAPYRCSLWMTRHGYCCYSDIQMFLMNDPSWILLLQRHTDVPYEWPVMDTVVAATYRCSLWMTRHGYCCCSDIRMFFMNDPSWILLLQRHTDVLYEWPVMDTVVAATYRCSLWMTRHGYCCCSDIQMFLMNDPSWILLLQRHTDVLYEWPVMDTVVAATYRCSLWMTRHGYCCCSDIQMFLMNDPSWILLLQRHTDVLYEWPVMDTVVAATYRCSLWMTRHGYCCCSHMQMFHTVWLLRKFGCQIVSLWRQTCCHMLRLHPLAVVNWHRQHHAIPCMCRTQTASDWLNPLSLEPSVTSADNAA